jgi:hypothetical protein
MKEKYMAMVYAEEFPRVVPDVAASNVSGCIEYNIAACIERYIMKVHKIIQV